MAGKWLLQLMLNVKWKSKAKEPNAVLKKTVLTTFTVPHFHIKSRLKDPISKEGGKTWAGKQRPAKYDICLQKKNVNKKIIMLYWVCRVWHFRLFFCDFIELQCQRQQVLFFSLLMARCFIVLKRFASLGEVLDAIFLHTYESCFKLLIGIIIKLVWESWLFYMGKNLVKQFFQGMSWNQIQI